MQGIYLAEVVISFLYENEIECYTPLIDPFVWLLLDGFTGYSVNKLNKNVLPINLIINKHN